jgi:hypothetical protein
MGVRGYCLRSHVYCIVIKVVAENFQWEGIVANYIKVFFLRNTTLGQCVQKSGDSHFWQGFMEVKPLFLSLVVDLKSNMEGKHDSRRIGGSLMIAWPHDSTGYT